MGRKPSIAQGIAYGWSGTSYYYFNNQDGRWAYYEKKTDSDPVPGPDDNLWTYYGPEFETTARNILNKYVADNTITRIM